MLLQSARVAQAARVPAQTGQQAARVLLVLSCEQQVARQAQVVLKDLLQVPLASVVLRISRVATVEMDRTPLAQVQLTRCLVLLRAAAVAVAV